MLRAYGFGLVVSLLFVLAALSARCNSIAIVLGAGLLITNYSFTENVVRLGPIEPYMVIFLGIFSLLFLNLHRVSKKKRRVATFLLATFLVYFLLLKEASIAILPAVGVGGLLFPKIVARKKLILLLAISGGIYFLVKYLLRGGEQDINYAGDYRFEPFFMLQNAGRFLVLLSNSLRPFFKTSIIAIVFVLSIKKLRKKIADHHFIYWLLVFSSFTVILFPWGYVLDRYLLLSIFAFSILVTILASRTMELIERIAKFGNRQIILFRLVTIIVLSNVFFLGASVNIARSINYRNWFLTITQFEAEQVGAIARYADQIVYINAKDIINNWEVVYEIPLHIKFFFTGKPEVLRVATPPPDAGVLFTRSSLEPVIDAEFLSKLDYPILESREYSVSQIDTVAFRESFITKPIQTLKTPPLLKEGFNYYWEIRSLSR
jgi:hypothetical protein